MAVTIRIPTPLRKFTEGKSEVDVEGGTIREAVSYTHLRAHET